MDGTFHGTIDAPPDGTLLAILEQSQDCIKIISVDGSLRFMNANGRKIMEIDSFEMVMGAPWWALWPEESQVKISDAVTRALDGVDSRFEAFCPTAKGTPRWWDVSVSPIHGADGNVTNILSISRDVTASRREQQADRARADAAEQAARMQTMVAQESRHRLANLLTVVSSLTTLVARHATTVEDFRDRLRVHLDHMSQAQDLLIGTNRRAATLRETVMAVVEADDRLRIADVPRMTISDQTVQVLALVLGELQTNAMKHGALSVENGSVALRLTENADGIHVLWTEDCREQRPEPMLCNGSGVELMKRMLSIYSDGIEFDWSGTGLRVEFTLPSV